MLTEVPGNPGLSVCNNIEGIQEHLNDQFSVDLARLTMFEIRPTGCWGFKEEVTCLRVDSVPHVEWTEVGIDEIVRAAGEPLPSLPSHDDLYAEVRVAGGGVFEPILWQVFEPVPVDQIPVPHNPSNCEHYERFKSLETSGVKPAGRRFIDSLTETDQQTCRYHHADWQWIAQESVRIITELGHVEGGEYVDAVNRIDGRADDQSWLRSLFDDPIDVAGGEFTNGQHRACALRFSGASHAAMVVGDDHRGDDEQIWIYQGDG